MCDLLGRRETFERYGRDECRLVVIGVGEACEHARIGGARSDHVDPHAGPRDLECGRFRQPFDGMLAGDVHGRADSADPSIGLTLLSNAFGARLGRLSTAQQTSLRTLLEKLN